MQPMQTGMGLHSGYYILFISELYGKQIWAAQRNGAKVPRVRKWIHIYGYWSKLPDSARHAD